MQRNRNFFRESSNAHRKSMSPVDDSRSHPRILSTKRPLHFGSSIEAWIFEAPNVRFLSVCNEIITFSWIRRMYLIKSILFSEFSVSINLRGAHIALYRPEVSSWLSSEDVIMASDRSQLSFQIGANNSQMIQRVLSIAVDTLIWRLHGSQNVL